MWLIITLIIFLKLCFFYSVSVDYICLAKLDRDQKNALMIPAKKAFGDVDNWDEKVLGRLCNLLEALPVRDILKLASDVVIYELCLLNIHQHTATVLVD